MYKLLISAGHFGEGGDPGAVAAGTTEHFEVREVVKKVAEILKAYKDIALTTILDGKTLPQKIAFTNGVKPDFSIELHLDAAGTGSANGASIYYLTGSKIQEVEATKFLATFCGKTAISSRGSKGDTTNRHGRLGFVRDIKNKSFLMELGFITNPNDLALVRTHAAFALASALLELFKIPTMDNTPLADWQKAALEFGKTINIKPDRPLETITRVEAIEMLRKLYVALHK